MKARMDTALWLLGLLALLYLAAYFASARRGLTLAVGGKWAAWPEYVGLPDSAEVCFRGLHSWDRNFLRPRFWTGTIPPEELRQQQLLAGDYALKAAQAAMTKE